MALNSNTASGVPPIPARPKENSLRFLLYSHDSWGLGHLKRSLAIAGALTDRFPNANVLVVTGSPCATQFELPSNCDVLKLPSVSKDADGGYKPRSLSGSLAQSLQLRTRLIMESYRSFDPHLILVDHQLTGLQGEVLGMLREARASNKKIIYGMRDVLDEPARVTRDWDSHEAFWALKLGYDQICVYGVPELFDPRHKYPVLKAFRDKIVFSGYVVPALTSSTRPPVPSIHKKVLVTMGGGEDGNQRIDTYLDALMLAPVSWHSHIIAGPLMPEVHVRHFKRRLHRHNLADMVHISRFHSNLPHLLQASDAVVSMAGYNSCAEILQSRIPAILMPRCHPRQEQLIRARRLAEMGLVQCLESLDPKALRSVLESALESPDPLPGTISLDGLDNFCDLITRLLCPQPDALESPVLRDEMAGSE